MNLIKKTLLGLSILSSVAVLGGCATNAEDADSEEGAEQVDAPVDVSHLVPKQANTGGSSCTTSTSCDRNYCCTTETCQFSTFITCVPNKRTSTVAGAYAR